MIYMKRGAQIKLVDESAAHRLAAVGFTRMDSLTSEKKPKKEPGTNQKGGTENGGQNRK